MAKSLLCRMNTGELFRTSHANYYKGELLSGATIQVDVEGSPKRSLRIESSRSRNTKPSFGANIKGLQRNIEPGGGALYKM